MPALQGGRVELAISRTGRRCSLPPGHAHKPSRHDHLPRIQEVRYDALVEVGQHPLAAPAPPALLPDALLVVVLKQPS